MARVLVIGDLHAPAIAPGYLEFCRQVGKSAGCDSTVLIGDIADFHGLSRFDREVGAPGVDDEDAAMLLQVREVAKTVPGKVRVCTSNHDRRVMRRLAASQMPTRLRPTYNQVFQVNWTWADHFVIDGVYYAHGDKTGGERPAWNLSRTIGKSVVCGHHHAKAGLSWLQTPMGRRFSLDLGCGCDINSPMLSYARDSNTLPVLACATVIEGIPTHHIMPDIKLRRAA